MKKKSPKRAKKGAKPKHAAGAGGKARRRTGSSERGISTAAVQPGGSRRTDGDPADPANLRFTDNHQWAHIKGNRIIVGFTEFAQQKFAEIIGVELPEPDDHRYEEREEIGFIEAVHSSASIYAPVAGTIIATNSELLSNPELINTDPYGEGWLIEMQPDNMADVDDLMDIDEYEGRLPEEEEE